MDFKNYMSDNRKLLIEDAPTPTVKPVQTSSTPNLDKADGPKLGSIKDSEKFLNNKPVKIIDKVSDSKDQIWVTVMAGDDKGLEIQVQLGDLENAPYNNDTTLPPDAIKTANNESTESKPEDVLKNAFEYLQKNEHKLKEKTDIEMFKKLKNIMKAYKLTKHLTSHDIDFLKKDVAPLFEDLLLGNEKPSSKQRKSPEEGLKTEAYDGDMSDFDDVFEMIEKTIANLQKDLAQFKKEQKRVNSSRAEETLRDKLEDYREFLDKIEDLS